jgi:sulfite exporter TauE/SafE
VAKPWIERLARLGYVAKGIVYAAIGLLTATAGVRRGGVAADRRDALRFIAGQPFGRLVLLVIAVGLIGYAIWRLLSALTDSEGQGNDWKGVAGRIGSFVRGLFYGSFAYAVLRLANHHGDGGGSSDNTSRHWTARALDQPFGRWLVVAAGLALIGYGVYQFIRAVRGKLSRHLDFAAVTAKRRRLLTRVSCFGIAARAVIFAVIGVSLIRAAQHRSASAAHGTSGALRELAALPYGSWVLTVMGLGLIAYGLYAFINARYRRIRVG